MRTALTTAHWALFVACALFAPFVATAQTAPLMQGNGVQIETNDVRAEALKVPREQHKEVLGEPKNIQQVTSNLFIRRSLAKQAEAEGLEKDPVTIAAMRIARERVLSDALLAKMDATANLEVKAIEAYAQNVYQAEAQRFQRPEEVSVRHILVRNETAGAKEKAEKLLADLKGGAKFDALAKEHSEDPGSAKKGGELGFMPKGKTVPEFEEAAFALAKPGDLSGVVKSQFGYHIIQLVDRRSAGKIPFAEVREGLVQEAKARLLAERRSAAVARLLEAGKTNDEAIEKFSASYR